MIALLGRLLGGIGARREYITLLAVAAAGAWLYVQYETARRDRDAWTRWAETSCASAGVAIDPDAAPHSLRKACAVQISGLAVFKRDAIAASNRLLAEHEADQAARSDRDAALARGDANAARADADRMEKENAKIIQDRVGGSWFDALNRLGGLHDPAPRDD